MDHKQLDQMIQAAVKKIGGIKENDICHYLPGEIAGYIHHFTMQKLKSADPQKLMHMLNEYILQPNQPKPLPPKPRASRGSRRAKDYYTFSKHEVEKVLQMARIMKDHDFINKLTPKKDLKTLKRELIASIRAGRIDEHLWGMYIDTVATQHSGAASTSQNIAAIAVPSLAQGTFAKI